MQISIIKESDNNEQRVSASPESVKTMSRLGAKVLVEKNAGILSGFTNNDFESAGAQIVSHADCFKSDIILCVRMPSKEDIRNFKKRSILIGLLNPFSNKDFHRNLNDNFITSLAMELIPRISRAQSMDVLSSQANLAGYRSVIDAANHFGKAFPMMMTAAGRVNPAKVMVLGVGVAGLQAIATAKRLGAVVCANDVRFATKEQVESLGAKFIFIEDEEFKNAETSEGYAKEMSDNYKNKQAELLAKTIANQDIIICTALIPGRKAPILVSEDMVNTMSPGSVIIDLAVESGGNCPLSILDKTIEHNCEILIF